MPYAASAILPVIAASVSLSPPGEMALWMAYLEIEDGIWKPKTSTR
jgi:hypothetical protein